jgi:hypothetical protein
MTITKCDICKKEIKKDQAELSLVLSGGDFGFINHTICMACATPVMAFVKKHHLDERKRPSSRAPRRAA